MLSRFYTEGNSFQTMEWDYCEDDNYDPNIDIRTFDGCCQLHEVFSFSYDGDLASDDDELWDQLCIVLDHAGVYKNLMIVLNNVSQSRMVNALESTPYWRLLCQLPDQNNNPERLNVYLVRTKGALNETSA